MLFAYFGPETVLPLTSILATIGGFVLLFGQGVSRLASRAVRRLVDRLRGLGSIRKSYAGPHTVGSALRIRRAARSKGVSP